VQPIAQLLQLIPAEIAGWMAVVAGFAVLAMLLRWLDPTRSDILNLIIAPPPVRQLEPGMEFQKLIGILQPTSGSDLQTVQKLAITQVDAADYAINLMKAELAKVTSFVVAPTFEPLRQLVREPAPVPAQPQPLAA
jgi:hypothetical protein